MFLFSMLLLFLLACLAAWVLIFPASRDVMLLSLASLGLRFERRVLRYCRPGQLSQLFRLGQRQAADMGRAMHAALRFARRHALLLLSGLLLLTVPVMLACLLSGRSMLAGFDGGNREMNSQVADLLKGEQLAASAPLPPAVFSTAEVVLVRPMLDGANRNWQLLDAEFSQRLLLVFKIMKETHGYDMAILEGYRSPERQNLLAAAGSSVTSAKAFQSFHQFGLAADCAFMRDGKLLISEKDPWAMRGYRLYGEVAEAAGLHWGGRWAMMDFGHAELRQAGAVKK